MKITFKEKFEIKSHFEPILSDLAKVDQKLYQQIQAFDPRISGYVEYAVENGGKRIRPALVLLAARATGGIRPIHHELSVIVELVHLATLVHDDILDHAGLRRGMPTMRAKWGPEISVLLGDCLFAQALKLCTRFEDMEVSRAIATAANEVCTGEIIQTQRRFDLNISLEEYLNTIRMKTGALFRVSMELSAYLNGIRNEELQVFRDYGDALGTAYQIYDDCLDLMGDESAIGKTLGTDLARGKLTLPVLHMLRQLNGSELESVSETLLKADAESLPDLLERIHSSGGFAYSIRKARELLNQAEKSLQLVEPRTHLDALVSLSKSFSSHLGTLC
ncbi:MAG: polyprenyl synthetase family protein [Candidatus Methylacidiphilales bacterium]